MQGDTDILESEIRAFLALGYRVTDRSQNTAQLILPRSFSFGWAFVWFLVFGVGVFVYLAYYLSKRDTIMYLSVGDDGQLYRQMSGSPGPQPTRGVASQNVCPACGYANEDWRGACRSCGKLLPRGPRRVA